MRGQPLSPLGSSMSRISPRSLHEDESSDYPAAGLEHVAESKSSSPSRKDLRATSAHAAMLSARSPPLSPLGTSMSRISPRSLLDSTPPRSLHEDESSDYPAAGLEHAASSESSSPPMSNLFATSAHAAMLSARSPPLSPLGSSKSRISPLSLHEVESSDYTAAGLEHAIDPKSTSPPIMRSPCLTPTSSRSSSEADFQTDAYEDQPRRSMAALRKRWQREFAGSRQSGRHRRRTGEPDRTVEEEEDNSASCMPTCVACVAITALVLLWLTFVTGVLTGGIMYIRNVTLADLQTLLTDEMLILRQRRLYDAADFLELRRRYGDINYDPHDERKPEL
jgi:hypothetical protein